MQISNSSNCTGNGIKEFFQNEKVQNVLKITAIALAALAALAVIITPMVLFPESIVPILGAITAGVIIGVIRFIAIRNILSN